MDYPELLLAERLRPAWLQTAQQLPRLYQALRLKGAEIRKALRIDDTGRIGHGPSTPRLLGRVVHVEGRGRTLRCPARARGAVVLSEQPWGLVKCRGDGE